MNRLFAVIIFSLLFVSCSRNSNICVIDGSVPSDRFDGEWMFLLCQVQNGGVQDVDSSKISNGKFHFECNGEQLRLIVPSKQSKKYLQSLLIITENGHLDVEINESSSASGTALNDNLQQWKTALENMNNFGRAYTGNGVKYVTEADSLMSYQIYDSLKLLYNNLSYKLLLENSKNSLGEFLIKNASYGNSPERKNMIDSLYHKN